MFTENPYKPHLSSRYMNLKVGIYSIFNYIFPPKFLFFTTPFMITALIFAQKGGCTCFWVVRFIQNIILLLKITHSLTKSKLRLSSVTWANWWVFKASLGCPTHILSLWKTLRRLTKTLLPAMSSALSQCSGLKHFYFMDQ